MFTRGGRWLAWLEAKYIGSYSTQGQAWGLLAAGRLGRSMWTGGKCREWYECTIKSPLLATKIKSMLGTEAEMDVMNIR